MKKIKKLHWDINQQKRSTNIINDLIRKVKENSYITTIDKPDEVQNSRDSKLTLEDLGDSIISNHKFIKERKVNEK